MCGIVGFINIGDKVRLQKSAEVMNHRGPDDEGFEWFDKWGSGFGHKRLSIIDLTSGGHQPMCTVDGRYWITFNGEIYNYKEIEIELRNQNSEIRIKTKSDTEILLLAYAVWGEKCLDKLNGMFAFAIFDTLTGEVFAARDRLGIKPFYFAEVDGGLIFASEVKAIFASGLVKAEPDMMALKTQMHFQVAPMTGFKGVFKLNPGHFLKFRIQNAECRIEEKKLFTTENTEKILGKEKKDVSREIHEIKEQKDNSPQITQIEKAIPDGIETDLKEKSEELNLGKEQESNSEFIHHGGHKDRGVQNEELKDKNEFGLEIGKWWEIDVREDDERSEEELVDELELLLLDAVRLEMVSDVPVGILLSGGLDSSILAAMMRKHYDGPIDAFTIKFSKDDQKFEKMEDDSVWAKKVADLLEMNYREIIIKPEAEKLMKDMVYHLDEPIADPAAINTFLISEVARQENIVVLLTGMGGDEVFGGYRKHLACLKADVYQRFVPRFVRNVVERIFANVNVASDKSGFKLIRWVKRFLSFASYERFERFLLSDLGVSKDKFDELFVDSQGFENTYYYVNQRKYYDNAQLSVNNDQLPINNEQLSVNNFQLEKKSDKVTKGSTNNEQLSVNNYQLEKKRDKVMKGKKKEISYLTRMCFCDTKTFLPAHNLTYSDKASMMAGVELRPPLIDHRVVEFMFGLPPKYRIKGNVQKYLLKKVAERYLPKDVVHRPKAPFGSPLRSWIKGKLSGEIDDKLKKEKIKKRGLFNPDVVWDYVTQDRLGKADFAHMVWRFLVMEVWFSTFFE